MGDNRDEQGVIRWDDAVPCRLRLSYWKDAGWRGLAWTAADVGWRAAAPGIVVELFLDSAGDHWRYRLSFEADFLTRVRVSVEMPGLRDPFHLIPGNVFGDNNLEHAEPGHFPNLTRRFPGNVSCSTYWEFRADRAPLPVSLLSGATGMAAVAIDPYSPAAPGLTDSREGFIRNGVCADLGDGMEAPSCGVTLGYRNVPRTFINKDQWGESTGHLARLGTAGGWIFWRPSSDRREAHAILRRLYDLLRRPPQPRISRAEGVAALTEAFLRVNWQPDREHFTNMRCIDPAKKQLTPWRTLAEVGWTGGGVIAYPLLIAAEQLGNAEARERALYLLDWVARAYHPDSGLLWDVCGKREGRQVDWWWSGYIVKGCHCAYTNGSGLYYLLKSLAHERGRGVDHPEWLETAGKALRTMMRLQRPDGNFGYSYRVDRPEMVDQEGFAGVWFVAALALAHRLTGDPAFLASARRGFDFYAASVRTLNCWGTPMDTWKSNDQEGNLGFIRAARLLHEETREDRYLADLEDGANYEYLWRYGFQARPEYAPLKGSAWNSCGGSITSVSNPHIHPMGIFVSHDLQYLAATGGGDVHARRCADGLDWGLNCIELYPEISGYGCRGVLTERFCPSDGLTIETFPDGSPSSLWFSYNGWAAAAVLEGLAECRTAGH